MHMRKAVLGKRIVCVAMTVILMLQSGFASSAEEEELPAKSQPGEVYAFDAGNNHPTNFNVPTQVYSIGGEFYIADAYNDQILHTNTVTDEPHKWYTVGMGLNKPHAIASDGTIYVAVDTDNNRIVTYVRNETGYQLVESIENVGIRPHYIVYDQATSQFYVWSSMTGTMYIYKRAKNSLALTLKRTRRIKDLDGYYTRSFTIDGGTIYFPCVGRSAIYAVRKSDFRVKAIYPVASELSEMVQLVHIQNYYYLVTSNDTTREKEPMFVRAKTPGGFGTGEYEDVKSMIEGINGIPYYITQCEDGHFYTPVNEGSCNPYICRFDVENDTITNVYNMNY